MVALTVGRFFKGASQKPQLSAYSFSEPQYLQFTAFPY